MTTQDNATLPTRQMEPIKLDNLLINFTTEFQRIWDTNGTRAKTVAFWRPTPTPDALPGYFPLGDIAIHRDGNINGEMTAVVVREGNSPGDDTKGNALSRPTDFELYWKDSATRWLCCVGTGLRQRLQQTFAQCCPLRQGGSGYRCKCQRSDLERQRQRCKDELQRLEH